MKINADVKTELNIFQSKEYAVVLVDKIILSTIYFSSFSVEEEIVNFCDNGCLTVAVRNCHINLYD